MVVSYNIMTDKRKLCFIIPEYNLSTPTHFNYLYEFIEKISNDFDIFLIAEKGLGDPPKGVTRFYIQKFNRPILRIIENELAIERARVLGYKTFYIHYSFLSAYNASIITRFFGGQVFYWNCGEPWKYKRSFARDFFEHTVYKLIHFLVTGTEGLKKKYAEHYKLPLEKIKVMPNYIDVSSIKYQVLSIKNDLKKNLNISSDTKVVLFVHRLSKRKGAYYLPEILKELKDENMVLLVVGDGPERKMIEVEASRQGLEAKIRFLGWLPQKDLAGYYAMADVFIMPSDEEGFPHVILESMVYGVPFVAFDVGGVKEIVPADALQYVVPSGDVKLFAEKTKELLLTSDESLNEMGAVLFKHVASLYDINSVSRDFTVLIKDIIIK